MQVYEDQFKLCGDIAVEFTYEFCADHFVFRKNLRVVNNNTQSMLLHLNPQKANYKNKITTQ